MENSNLLNVLSPYFNGDVRIERFFEENITLFSNISKVQTIDEFFAYTRVLYDYSLSLLNEGKIRKALYYFNEILNFIDTHEKIFSTTFENEKIYEYTLLNKGVALMKLKKHREAKIIFLKLEKLQPDNDDYKDYRVNCNLMFYSKLAWPLYIIAITVWTLSFIENWTKSDFVPRWAFDIAWFLWIIGLILQFGIPYFANKNIRKIQ